MSDFQSFDPNGNYGGQDNAQQELGYDPKYDALSQYARTAVVLGVGSVVFNFLLPVFFPLAFGAISIILAILAKGKRKKLTATGRRAVGFALTGIICHAVILSSSLISTWQAIRNPIQRAQLDSVTSQMYGTTVEQMIRDIDADLGTNLSGLLFGDSSTGAEDSSGEGSSSGENAAGSTDSTESADESSASSSESAAERAAEDSTVESTTEEADGAASSETAGSTGEDAGDADTDAVPAEESSDASDTSDAADTSSGEEDSTSPRDPTFVPPGVTSIASAASAGKEAVL